MPENKENSSLETEQKEKDRQISSGSTRHDRPSFIRGRSGDDDSQSKTSFAFSNVVLDDMDQPVQDKSEAAKPATSELTATINLTKNLVGSGIFTLPLSFSRASISLGLILLAVVCSMCAGSFILIARNCKALGVNTYREMGMKSIGPKLALVIDACIMINGCLGPLAYVILVCDFFEESLPPLTGWRPARYQLVMLDTLALILPLSYIKDLSPLRIPSMIALAIIAYIFFYVVIDWLSDFNSSIANFQGGMLHFKMGIFSSASLFTGAFSAHYNSPTFYRELGEDLDALKRVVKKAFSTAFVIYALFALAGYGMFGDAAKGNILKNYGEDAGTAVSLALFGMAFSITLSFPLVFNSGRAAFYALNPSVDRARTEHPNTVHYAVTTILVLCITSTACFVTDVAVVVGLVSAVLGQALCFIIPGAVYLKTTSSPRVLPLQGGEPVAPRSQSLASFSTLIMAFGMTMQVVGTLVVLEIVG